MDKKWAVATLSSDEVTWVTRVKYPAQVRVKSSTRRKHLKIKAYLACASFDESSSIWRLSESTVISASLSRCCSRSRAS